MTVYNDAILISGFLLTYKCVFTCLREWYIYNFFYYFTALDMQGCGISTTGAKSLLDVLKYNTTVVVLDVRRNPLIGMASLKHLLNSLPIFDGPIQRV
jgi:hypothetical protein